METDAKKAGEVMKKRKISIKLGSVAVIVFCWLVPIIVVMTIAGVLIDDSYQRSAQQEIESWAQNAIRIVEYRVEDAIDASKAVSYDGIVGNAYRAYQGGGGTVRMYNQINDYLKVAFARDENFKGVFINFWDERIKIAPYIIGNGTTTYSVAHQYQENAKHITMNMEDRGTNIHFFILDGDLYMARNLLTLGFEPYGMVIMIMDSDRTFRPLAASSRISNVMIRLDNQVFQIREDGKLVCLPQYTWSQQDICYTTDARGYTLEFSAAVEELDLLGDNPVLMWAVLAVALMVLPILGVVILLLYRHITTPMEVLAEANRRVEAGERGYQISEASANTEFQHLFDIFNAMSREQKHQFEQLYLEQQATQQAKIKALQSQINPHFLNNTLEIINWEARIAENDRVSAMIEALSTMLDAALDRDGRTKISLKEEMGYVDAYLYIIRERLGDGLRVTKEVDAACLGQMVPRLILQPIVENAVEHDLTASRGGRLCLRVFRRGNAIVLEVSHDGKITPEDRQRIDTLLSGDPQEARNSVGIRNVYQRLKLIYGERGKLILEENCPGTVTATVEFPMD